MILRERLLAGRSYLLPDFFLQCPRPVSMLDRRAEVCSSAERVVNSSSGETVISSRKSSLVSLGMSEEAKIGVDVGSTSVESFPVEMTSVENDVTVKKDVGSRYVDVAATTSVVNSSMLSKSKSELISPTMLENGWTIGVVMKDELARVLDEAARDVVDCSCSSVLNIGIDVMSSKSSEPKSTLEKTSTDVATSSRERSGSELDDVVRSLKDVIASCCDVATSADGPSKVLNSAKSLVAGSTSKRSVEN